jgi:hypothetical protein
MANECIYTCPSCTNDCSVGADLIGKNVVCPSCAAEFFSTPPEGSPSLSDIPPLLPTSVPAKLPFFKSGRKKLLAAKLSELVADGELDKNDERELVHLAAQLELDKSDLEALQKEKFLNEFALVKRRIESNFMLSDEDLEAMKALERKYDIKLSLTGAGILLREYYMASHPR